MEKEVIFKKIRLNSEQKILILNAPSEYIMLLEGITFDDKPKTDIFYDFVQVFGYQQDELGLLVKFVEKSGKYDCLFWACYPKGTGKIKSDIRRKTVWNAFELVGLDTVTQVAIDAIWSALRRRPVEMVGK